MSSRLRRWLSAESAGIIGPGLILPPLFLVLIWSVKTRPVEPVVPQPRLNGAEATRALQSLLHKESSAEAGDGEDALLRIWSSTKALELRVARTAEDADDFQDFEQSLAVAQQTMAETCQEARENIGVKRTLLVGEVISARLARAMLRLETSPTAATEEAEEVGGRFLELAEEVGLIDWRGRLTCHPLVPAVVARAGFHAECGFAGETGFEAIERAAFDVFQIRYAKGVHQSFRATAAARFLQYDPAYPAARAQAAFLVGVGSDGEAVEILEEALGRAPSDRVVRNNLAYMLLISGR